MREITGDLWNTHGDALCITTNFFVKNNGRAVMGAGCAKEAVQRFPDIDLLLGQQIKRNGRKLSYAGPAMLANLACDDEPTKLAVEKLNLHLVFFPVKHHWREQADIDLIAQSARELVELTDRMEWNRVVIPRPGCGNGRLNWNYVKQRIEPIFDDRFFVITFASDPAEEEMDGKA